MTGWECGIGTLGHTNRGAPDERLREGFSCVRTRAAPCGVEFGAWPALVHQVWRSPILHHYTSPLRH